VPRDSGESFNGGKEPRKVKSQGQPKTMPLIREKWLFVAKRNRGDRKQKFHLWFDGKKWSGLDDKKKRGRVAGLTGRIVGRNSVPLWKKVEKMGQGFC